MCNSANMEGMTIYASSLLPCVWNGAPYGYGFEVNKTQAIQQVFHWNDDVFVFENCSSKSYVKAHNRDRRIKEITTDALLLVNDSALRRISASPGLRLNLSGNTLDELGQNTYSVFRGDSNDPKAGRLVSGGRYVTGLNMEFEGEPRRSFDLKLSSPWTLGYIIDTNASLLPCPPGLLYNKKKKGNVSAQLVRVHSRGSYLVKLTIPTCRLHTGLATSRMQTTPGSCAAMLRSRIMQTAHWSQVAALHVPALDYIHTNWTPLCRCQALQAMINLHTRSVTNRTDMASCVESARKAMAMILPVIPSPVYCATTPPY